jgi:16S rRNA (guanine527-N7)-methyltransferase
VDNAALQNALISGAAQLGVQIGLPVAQKLLEYQSELFRWNAKVNLVGRAAAPMDVLERHLIDSLAIAPEVAVAGALMDVGAGAGLPGIPLKVLRPALDVTLVESVAKRVAFMRRAISLLQLGAGVRVAHERARGSPRAERLPLVDAAVARAFAPLPEWLRLGFRYVVPGGRVIAMLANPTESSLAEAAAEAKAALVSIRRYELPFSKAARAVAVFAAPD